MASPLMKAFILCRSVEVALFQVLKWVLHNFRRVRRQGFTFLHCWPMAHKDHHPRSALMKTSSLNWNCSTSRIHLLINRVVVKKLRPDIPNYFRTLTPCPHEVDGVFF